MLADAPGKEQTAQLLGSRRTPGDHLQAGIERGGVDSAGVGVLHQQSTRHVLDHGSGRRGAHFDEAQILLRAEALAGLGGEAGRGDGFDKELGDLLGGGGVHLAVDADDSAKGRDWIAGEGLDVSLKDGCAGGSTAGVGVLHDDRGGLVELLHELPAGVQIDDVVEAEFLALQLARPGDAQAGAIGIKRGALVRIFAVTQGLCQRKVDAQRRHLRCGRRLRQGLIGCGSIRNLVESVGDRRVIGCGQPEGLTRQTPARLAAQTSTVSL